MLIFWPFSILDMLINIMLIQKKTCNRNAISKMRISAHRLPVETGRYSGTPRNERMCPLCKNGVGNELHYLLECNMPKMVQIRVPILQKICSNDSMFNNMSNNLQCKYRIPSKKPPGAFSLAEVARGGLFRGGSLEGEGLFRGNTVCICDCFS